MLERVQKHLTSSLKAFVALSHDARLQDSVVQAAQMLNTAFARGNSLWIAGNGGSAADAQHFAAELTGYFGGKADKPLPATAITTDTSFLTAWGNDDTFDNVFVRYLRGHARAGDVFFAISTSGNSRNILRGLHTARVLNVQSVGLLGQGGEARTLCDLALCMPTSSTANIQELHIAVIHAICQCIDR